MTFSCNAIWRRCMAGAFLTWLVPFFAAVPLYSPNGLASGKPLFKSILIAIKNFKRRFA